MEMWYCDAGVRSCTRCLSPLPNQWVTNKQQLHPQLLSVGPTSSRHTPEPPMSWYSRKNKRHFFKHCCFSAQAEPIQKCGRIKLIVGPWSQCKSSWREQESSSPGSVWFLCLTKLLKVKLGGNLPSASMPVCSLECLVQGRVAVPAVQSPKETISAALVILRLRLPH